MKTSFKTLFFLKREKEKKNGCAPIHCRITIDGTIAAFTIRQEINPNLWDAKRGRANGKSEKAVYINNYIDLLITRIRNTYHDLLTQEGFITAERLRNALFGKHIKQQSLLDLFKEHNEDVEKLIGFGKTKATYQKYERTRKHLEDFIKVKHNLSDIPFKDINHKFICDFEIYLKTTGGCNNNTTAKFIQFFKRIFIIARNNGWALTDPFSNYKIRIKNVNRGYLTEEEVSAIMNKKFSTDRLSNVRDIFIFSCYTGLAYIDVKNLKESNIVKDTEVESGLKIVGKREKTDVEFKVPLLEIPLKILGKHKDKQPHGLLLPMLSNQKMNSYLKEIGSLCGIHKELTYHVARHSNCSFLLKTSHLWPYFPRQVTI